METHSPTPEARQSQRASLAGATGVLALGNLLSRVLGLAREMVLTFFFGASAVVDAFQVALIIIRAVYDLLIGGHINGAIVPVLSEIVTLQGKKELWRVVNALMSVVIFGLALLVCLMLAFAQPIVDATASGASATTRQTAAELLRLTSPALVFMGVFAVLSGTLYALKQFTFPAFASAVLNGAIVLVTLIFAPGVQLSLSPATPEAYLRPLELVRPSEGIVVVAVGWLVGAFAQMALQFLGLRGAQLRLTVRWGHPALRRIALLYAPVMLALIMDTLIMRPYTYNLASQTGDGSIAYMNWATTLIQFPQGLVATAISVAILPMLSAHMAQTDDASQRAFKDTLGLGLRFAITLIIPATFGLWALGYPIVQMLFEHGAFLAQDTAITVQALNLYLLGLPFAAVDLLLVYAFYARKDTLTPTLVGIFSLVVYMFVAAWLLPSFGLFSLMIADSVKHAVHAVVSGVLLARRIGTLQEQRLLATTLKTLLAGIGMSAVAWLITPPITQAIGAGNIVGEALIVGVCGSLSALTFVVLALIMGVEEVRWAMMLVKKRMRRA
jgi:putative peptidoglycan lipid II flippase